MTKLFLLYKGIALQSNLSTALSKVSSGEIALIWESAVLNHLTYQSDSCKLKTVSLGLGEFYYAFALRKNSPFTGRLL